MSYNKVLDVNQFDGETGLHKTNSFVYYTFTMLVNSVVFLVYFYAQMTLDSITFYGFTVVVVVSIAGFATQKQEGNDALIKDFILLLQFF